MEEYCETTAPDWEAGDWQARAGSVGTGLRIGELAGLRWCDIDLDEGIIDVNHTLVHMKESLL